MKTENKKTEWKKVPAKRVRKSNAPTLDDLINHRKSMLKALPLTDEHKRQYRRELVALRAANNEIAELRQALRLTEYDVERYKEYLKNCEINACIAIHAIERIAEKMRDPKKAKAFIEKFIRISNKGAKFQTEEESKWLHDLWIGKKVD